MDTADEEVSRVPIVHGVPLAADSPAEAGETEGPEILPAPQSNMPDSMFPNLHKQEEVMLDVPPENRPATDKPTWEDPNREVTEPPRPVIRDRFTAEEKRAIKEAPDRGARDRAIRDARIRADRDEAQGDDQPKPSPRPKLHGGADRVIGRVSLDEAAEFTRRQLSEQLGVPEEEIEIVNLDADQVKRVLNEAESKAESFEKPTYPDTYRNVELQTAEKPLRGETGAVLMGFSYSILMPNGDVLTERIQIPAGHDGGTPHGDMKNLSQLAEIIAGSMMRVTSEISMRQDMARHERNGQPDNRCQQ